MISKHTPPGTRVVCIDDTASGLYMQPGKYGSSLDGLTKGVVYTVKNICLAPKTKLGVGVILHEITRPNPEIGFALERFKLAALPKCLTDCLTANPVDTNTCETV